jgi:hypothetical protein
VGKRSDFERRPQDKYPTPYSAVLPLLPHLPVGARFVEPCAGDRRLVRHLETHGLVCLDAFDIEPEHPDVACDDALEVEMDVPKGTLCITNPPWDRKVLHPLIDHWRQMMPTWFLFDADWAHTKQAAPFLPYCRKIVSIGRVKWIEDSKMTGKDNAAWFLFDATPGETRFYGRT